MLAGSWGREMELKHQNSLASFNRMLRVFSLLRKLLPNTSISRRERPRHYSPQRRQFQTLDLLSDYKILWIGCQPETIVLDLLPSGTEA